MVQRCVCSYPYIYININIVNTCTTFQDHAKNTTHAPRLFMDRSYQITINYQSMLFNLKHFKAMQLCPFTKLPKETPKVRLECFCVNEPVSCSNRQQIKKRILPVRLVTCIYQNHAQLLSLKSKRQVASFDNSSNLQAERQIREDYTANCKKDSTKYGDHRCQRTLRPWGHGAMGPSRSGSQQNHRQRKHHVLAAKSPRMRTTT